MNYGILINHFLLANGISQEIINKFKENYNNVQHLNKCFNKINTGDLVNVNQDLSNFNQDC